MKSTIYAFISCFSFLHLQLVSGTCSNYRLVVNAKAPYFIDIFLPLSYGKCSSDTFRFEESILQYEAIRWSLERTNKRFGQIGARIVQNSFVPGIQIGLRIFDICDKDTLPTEHCKIDGKENTIGSLGFADFKGEVSTTPAGDLKLNPRHLIPVKEKTSAILRFLDSLRWQKLTIFVEEDSISLNFLKIFLKEAESWNVCVTNVVHIPSSAMADPQQKWWKSDWTNDDILASTIIVVGNNSTLKVIRHLEKALKFVENQPNIILTELPSSVELKYFEMQLHNLWVVTYAPTKILDYDYRLQAYLSNTNILKKKNTSNDLLAEYIEGAFNCTTDYLSNPSLQSCSGIRLETKSTTLFKLKQNEAILTALHAVFTLINAFKQAWKELCSQRNGPCDALNKLNKEEFQDKFLSTIEFRHTGPGSRSPPELRGRKVKSESQLYDSTFKMYKVIKNNRQLQAEEVLSLDSSELDIVNQFIFEEYKLAGGIRCYDKMSTSTFLIPQESTTHQLFFVASSTDDFSENETRTSEKLIYEHSSDDIIVLGLFPVHEPSMGGTHCSDVINREGLQEVEAFLWAIEQLNKHKQVLPNTRIGTLVLDTCGSKIKTLNQVTSLLQNSYSGVDIDMSKILCVVLSSDPGTSRIVGETLASLNITLINLGMSDLLNPFSLQMKRSVNDEAEALVQILHNIGWNFVSLLTSIDDFESYMGGDAFKNVAKASKICVAEDIKLKTSKGINLTEEQFERFIGEISKRSEWGVRVFITFLTEEHLHMLLSSLQKGIEKHIFRVDQFIFLGSTSWGDSLQKFRNYHQIMGGLLVLKDGQLIVENFSLVYRLLTPEANKRNPWFKQYWEQEFNCAKTSCSKTESMVLSPPESPSVPRVIQSVFSFGAALTQLLDHLCPHAHGKMCPGLPLWRQRVVINEFLRNTEVSRVDDPSEYFQFSNNFHGNAPLKVLNPLANTKREIGLYVDSHLKMSQAFGTHANGSSFAFNSIALTCRRNCQLCHDLNSEFVFLESRHKLYLLVIFDIHDPGEKILECGPMRSDQGIQNMESLLLSLDETNKKSEIKIGALVFDSCWSREKVVKDVSNLLSGRLPDSLKKKISSLENIVGIISGSQGSVLKQILDVTRQYSFTTVATQASQSFSTDDLLYPTLITLAPSNAVYARTITALANYWKWQLVSVVYSKFGDSKDIYKFLKRNLYESGIVASTVRAIPKNEFSIELMFDIWTALVAGVRKGSHVVILLLENPHELLFLQTASKLLQEGFIHPTDLLYVTTKAIKPFVENEAEALGSLTIQPMIGYFEGFASHFKNLSIIDRKNPYSWFHEFWAKINGCQGAECQKVPDVTLKKYPFRQAKGVVETANAVRLFSNSLKIIYQRHCKDETNKNLCYDSAIVPDLRKKVNELAKSIRFSGVDKQPVAIASDGSNSAATLQILNFRKLSKNHSGLVRVGLFNDMKGLILNGSQVVTYDENGKFIQWKDIPSSCEGSDHCIQNNINDVAAPYATVGSENQITIINVNKTGQGYTQMFPRERFGISVFLPLHHQNEEEFFACDGFFSESVFQNLVAIAYALSLVNANNPDLGIGAIVFDFCDRIEKARGQAFSYFSSELQNNYNDISMKQEQIFASLSLSDLAAEAVSTILASNYIPQFSSPVVGRSIRDRNHYSLVMSSIPTRSREIQLYVSLLKTFKWKYVSIIFDNDEIGQTMAQLFRSSARKEDICIGDSLQIPKRLSEEFSHEIVHTLSAHWKPKIVIFLIRDLQNVLTLLKIFAIRNESENFVLLAGNPLGNLDNIHSDLNRIMAGALTFTLETYDLPDFRSFFANLTLNNHYPIDKQLFEEFFQHKHHCRLSNSFKVLNYYNKECTGLESVHADDVAQDPFVFHTVLAVNTVANGLDSYLNKRCSGVAAIEDCKIVQAELFLELMESAKLHMNNTIDTNSFDRKGAFGFYIWNYRKIGRDYGFVNIGKWENGRLDLEKSSIEFKLGSYVPQSKCLQGRCLEICAFQSPVYASMQIPEPRPIDYNFRGIYGIITGSLSLMGIILILVTIIYFMFLFPTIEGTSLLGYFILIGCLIIYSVNFAFIFQPSIGTCALRRLMMGIGYVFIHSSLLIKVINSWRLASYHGSDFYLAKPGMILLVFAALSFVQIILGAAWLTMYPPSVDLIGDKFKCSPSETFEKDLIVSFAYVMLLNIVILIFCAETWHYKDAVKETRWVLSTELCIGFSWIIWISVAILGPEESRDPAIVIGNLASATCTLLFLYSRRSYIYSQLKEEMKDFDLSSHMTSATDLNSSQQKLTEQELLRTQTINPLRETMPGTQFVGDQEVSFRTVTLPPEVPHGFSQFQRGCVQNKRFRQELHEELSINASDSSPPLSSVEDDDGSDSCYDTEKYAHTSQTTAVFAVKRPSLRSLGSGPMLVYLTDGKSIGEVSRI